MCISSWRLGLVLKLMFFIVQSLTKELRSFCWKQTDLDDIVIAIFSVNSLHGTDVKAPKHLSAGVHPQPVSGTQRHQQLLNQ